MHLAELDLTDDYIFARLNAADRERFDRMFLISADRRQGLNVARALRDRFGPASLTGWRAAIREKVGLFLHLNRSIWRYAFAVLILTLLMATVWLVTKEPQIALRVFPKRAPTNSKTSNTRQEAEHSSGAASQTHQETSPEKPIHGEATFSIVLRANDKSSTVDLSHNDHKIVRVQLMLQANNAGTYQAEMLTIDGRSVFNADALKPSEGGAAFDIPARLLKSGDYQIKLKRADEGSGSDVTTYYFRVQ